MRFQMTIEAMQEMARDELKALRRHNRRADMAAFPDVAEQARTNALTCKRSIEALADAIAALRRAG